MGVSPPQSLRFSVIARARVHVRAGVQREMAVVCVVFCLLVVMYMLISREIVRCLYSLGAMYLVCAEGIIIL